LGYCDWCDADGDCLGQAKAERLVKLYSALYRHYDI
jgi:hypothetical protein